MRPFALALVAGGLLAAAPPALAQGFIIVERPVAPPVVRPRPRPLPLQRHFPLVVQKVQVRVRIDGPVATTEVLQTFRNPLPRRLEGTYMFPLPPDAALDRFSMWIDGKEMQGELLPAEKALEVYTGIVRRMQDPALLQYAGRGLFKVRIFPIEPRSTKRVKLTYRQLLTADGGRVRYRYPLDTERFSAQPLEECVISVDLRSDVPLKGISSPWHRVDLRREGDHAARASWEARDVRPDRDFVLDYDLSPDPIGISVRTHARPGEDGTFLLLVTPGAEVGRAERMAKDVVFVFDTSGSMAGEKMDQARRALRYMIQRLDPSDRFAVIDFATDARAYKDGLVPASAEERRGALAYVDELVARGGTATDEALQRAMALRSEEAGRPFSVVFLTDGQPTIGETQPERILARLQKVAPAQARVFVWGVGNEVNTHLLDAIAQRHRGDSYYVLPGEDIEVAMSGFYDKIAFPVLTDLSLHVEGVRVYDLVPRNLPDLFAGGQLAVVGRFRGEGAAVVRLTGKVNGEPREIVHETTFRRDEANPHVPRLWARRRIGFLLEQIRLHGENAELKDEVVRLARRYGLPTPYTSYLVLEEGALAGGPRPLHRRDGRVPPAGGLAPAEDADAAAADAFGRFERAARKARGKAAAPAPPSASSGEGAVAGAREAGRLRRGEAIELRKEEQKAVEEVMRHIGDRTFYRAGEVWIDSTAGKRSPAWKKIGYLSEAYFALLKEHPELGPCLALGKVVVRAGEQVYEIR